MPAPVYEAVLSHLALEQEIGGYEAAAHAQDKFDSLYTNLAGLLNAAPSEIAFIENASRAWHMAVYGIDFKPGDRVLTHISEYASNYLALLQLKKNKGIEIDFIPSDSTGQIDVDAITPLITPRTKLIAVTHVPSQGGLVNPAAEIGQAAKTHNLIYVLDACQSVGQMPVDVQSIGCDILMGTGRKFLRGPRGTGFLYVSRRVLEQIEPPFIDLQAANWTADHDYTLQPNARRFETWERHIAGQIGLARAAEYALGIGLGTIKLQIDQLSQLMRAELAALNGVKVHDLGSNPCGIITFTHNKIAATDIVKTMNHHHINISSVQLKNARLDLDMRNIPALARASVHYYNTEDEVRQFIDIVKKL